MAIAYVASSYAQAENAESASARTLQFATTIASNAWLLVLVPTFNTGITLTVSDDVNGAYTQVGSYVVGSTFGTSRMSLWRVLNTVNGSQPTVTVTPSASAYVSIALAAFTGLHLTAPDNSQVKNEDDSGTPTDFVTGSVTANADDLVIAGYAQGSGGRTSTVDAAFTQLSTGSTGGTGEGFGYAYDLAAGGNESATFTLSAGSRGVCGAWSFKIAAAASRRMRRMLMGVGK